MNLYNRMNNKINEIEELSYTFKKNPNLKYKLNIVDNNDFYGYNDIFEIFLSYKDKKEYLVSKNKNYDLDIYLLINVKKIISLKGHETHIDTVRYFINNNNYNEYLISADEKNIVIIWDITNNYSNNYRIQTKYDGQIYSCYLLFPYNDKENYIITSTSSVSNNKDKSATKLYSLKSCKFVKNIYFSNLCIIFYLLSWYNKNNNKYYIIQLASKKIIISNLLEDELYSQLINIPESSHYSGFIYYKNNKDYLITSSENGFINIWDLYNKSIYKVIETYCDLIHIIEWNNKYCIAVDYNKKSFKIINLEQYKIVSDIKGIHTKEIKCIKKIYHPIYGESLLSAGRDNTIKLWAI